MGRSKPRGGSAVELAAEKFGSMAVGGRGGQRKEMGGGGPRAAPMRAGGGWRGGGDGSNHLRSQETMLKPTVRASYGRKVMG